MGKGEKFKPEWRTFVDSQTGVEIRQLTNYKAHSHHLYFTNSGWYDGKLIFGSDRCNRTNLFSLDLASGEITQLTDLDPADADFLFTSLNPCRPEAYFWHERTLVALDLTTFEERRLYRLPDGYAFNMTSVTADGKYVCTGIYEDLSARFKVDLLHGYVGFAEYWEAMPHSQILKISTEDGSAEVVFEENYWIGHANASPTQPSIATYCHEGPWYKVDHRIWGVNLDNGEVWKIRPPLDGEPVGHEYWLADGEHIGYHGRYKNGDPFYGSIRYDNTERVEAAFPSDSSHFQSNTLDLIVGDGSREKPQLLLWRFRDGRFEGPRVVLTHRGTFQVQQLHVHPRFSPDGKQILFTSDLSGYGQLYLVETPEFDTLPEA
ncbi:MAG TPA: oligogalacturonate lyase family protein [Oceanobacillus sp.]|nr:oligogalacturonate lyase family protein [Oceanobacillus sp.]